ncbi:MAG: hypothetical protein II712_03315 [Erysipelotrichaceae bacterium]|nr:hypothetical protein [Erysipelotrichaceae bacterium]
MKKALWNAVNKLSISPKKRRLVFLLILSAFYALGGLGLWLLIGQRMFAGRTDWLICFIGYPAIIFGFLFGMLYLFNNENRNNPESK